VSAVHISSIDITNPPFAKSFAGHETFAFRHAWLKKGVDRLLTDPEVFQRDDAITLLGVGKNMVRSIRHWCLATRMAEEEPGTRAQQLRPTALGLDLLSDGGWDPYLEDDATLWLLHWNLASAGTKAATWYWAFNRFHEYAFTRLSMVETLLSYIRLLGWTDIAESSLKRDVDCFVHTYLSRKEKAGNGDDPIECPLTNLGLLIQEPDSDRLRFVSGPKPSLPASVFAYSLADFWNQKCCERLTLDLRDILGSEGCPTLVFRLSEDSVLEYLDKVSEATAGSIVFEDTALVRRAVKRNEEPIDTRAIIGGYYGRE